MIVYTVFPKVHLYESLSMNSITKFPTRCGMVALLIAVASIAKADQVYQLIDGAAGGQNGNTLTGTITFDSACGTSCSAQNIVDFSISWSGSDPASLSANNSSEVVFSNVDSLINVTSSGITIDYGGTPTGLNNLTLRDNEASNQPAIGWGNQLTHAGPFRVYRGVNSTGLFSWDDTRSGRGPVMIATAVPEPTAYSLCGLLTMCLMFRRFIGHVYQPVKTAG